MIFRPLFRRYIWGGRRLANMLHKPIGDEDCAESWEIVDHGADQSTVQNGPLAGAALSQLLRDSGAALLGPELVARIHDASLPPQLQGRFPLLLKFLDASHDLSVQVHPDNAMAATLDPPDLGKTEAWYVMHAEPGAKIFAGLKAAGVTRLQFAAAIQNGTVAELLHSFEPGIGDCVFIRAGTVHAIGAGLLIAEIQQASDTTFRVFDWNRVDARGNARQLHIEQSLSATNFDLGPVNPVEPEAAESDHAQTLVSCDQFVVKKLNLRAPIGLPAGCCRIMAVLKGSISVSGMPEAKRLHIGRTFLIPFACGPTEIAPCDSAELLEITIPTEG